MRVKGDADGCARAGATLLRTATPVGSAAATLQQARWSQPGWIGAAAQGWARLSGAQATDGFALADRIAAAGRALLQHASTLEELQLRAGRLRAEAHDAGLDLDDDGQIRPIALFFGPPSSPLQLQAALLLSHRQDVRAQLLSRIAILREEQTLANERLTRALSGVGSAPGCGPDPGSGVSWAPTWWDLPPVAVGLVAHSMPASWSGPTGPVLKRALGHVGPVLRNAPGAAVVSFGYGVAVDTTVNDLPMRQAVEKNGLATAAGTATAVAVGLGIAAAPVSVPVLVAGGAAVVIGGAVSYGVGKGWELLHADDKNNRRRPRPASRPTPTPMRATCR